MHRYPAPIRFLPIIKNREMTLPINAVVLMLSNAIRRLDIKHLDSPHGPPTKDMSTLNIHETAPT
jgi:hypothetical protein